MQLDMRPGTSLKGEKTKFSGHWVEGAVCVFGGGAVFQRKRGVNKNYFCSPSFCGDSRSRTDDPLLAKQML